MTGRQEGISGRIARRFQDSQITPLLALAGLLLGLFAIIITPKEEEPQIDVTFANVFVPFPGASAEEVESLVSTPAEQIFAELADVDHVYSVSRPGMAVLTVQFKVGVPRREAIVDLYNQVFSNQDWLPRDLGTGQPLIKPKGIDDVPIVSLTLWGDEGEVSASKLADVAHSLEVDIKRVDGTRDVYTLGAPDDVVKVELDPAAMSAYGVDYQQLARSIRAGNRTSAPTNVVRDNQVIRVRAGDFLSSADEVARLVVGVQGGEPVFLEDIARVERKPDVAEQAVRMGFGPAAQSEREGLAPAVTMAVAKQAGTNAVDIADAVIRKVNHLDNISIPDNVNVDVTRNYGQTAADKASKLIQKLLFATIAVIALVLLTLGWREATIVGAAIIVTLLITLFASWAWGFTLNRVSLFALIFSIGILVDDAIVVVENIHRHIALGDTNLKNVIPRAVDEVGGPTILATLTVIAALMPMAFVTGLMGPYMSPIPINASTGMLISLLVAFIFSPWLARHFLRPDKVAGHGEHQREDRISATVRKVITPFMDPEAGRKRRRWLYIGTLALILVTTALPVFKVVILKMLPFDNKSEIQVVVDMPEGTPMEKTLHTLNALAGHVEDVPEVHDYQLYAGTSAPINFNGLVRQYFLRSEPHQGDLQINLVDKHHRERQSHDIARALREPLKKIGDEFDANVKIVEVPPGPPVRAPIVAEVYGPDQQARMETAEKMKKLFGETKDIVDIDTSMTEPAPEWHLHVDRQRAARLGLDYGLIVQTLGAALSGEDVSYIHQDGQKYAVPIRVELPEADKSHLDSLLAMRLTTRSGERIALSQVVSVEKTTREQVIQHKDLQPAVFVTGNMAGPTDSPLYGMFDMVGSLNDGQPAGIEQHFIDQPEIVTGTSVKWDGEWQITYETFRDMGIAYAVGMILIYLLVVAQFGSYLVPLIIMAPIPLTVIGVMPGHALLDEQFTATSMIGMIALAGIIVRNSILLVDFINEQLRHGTAFRDAVIHAAAVRAKPILLTALAAIIGATFILDDPIFSGLAVSLIFGILVSSLLTLVVIPLLYYTAYSGRQDRLPS